MKFFQWVLFVYLLAPQISFSQSAWPANTPSPNWVRNYGNFDYPADASYGYVTFTNEGNIYVFGSDQDSFPPSHYQLRQYYDNGGNLLQEVKDKNVFIDEINFDSLGNIYALGNDSLGGFIIKYNPQWVEQWRINSWMRIAVDLAGCFFTTEERNDTIITSKYNSEGVKQWEASCYWEGFQNSPVRHMVDGQGGVVVLGVSHAPPNYGSPVVVKYAADGTEEWRVKYAEALHYPHASVLAIDHSGSVYIAVPLGEQPDVLTHLVKFTSSGMLQWVKTKPGFPRALVLNSNGDVNLLNDWNGCYLVKYDSNGVLKWQDQLVIQDLSTSASGIAVDENDFIYVVASTDSSGHSGLVSVKYNQQGTKEWIFKYPGSGSSANLNSFKIKSNGNACFTGSNDQMEGILVKVNAAGMREWEIQLAGTKYPKDFAFDVGIDSQGNVYSFGSRDYHHGLTVLKYDPSGNLIWKQIDDSTQMNGTPVAKVSADGSIFLSYCMSYDSGGSYYEPLIIKSYNSTGELKWSYYYQPPADTSLRPAAILVDHSGYMYLISCSNGPLFASTIIQKFSPSGSVIWSTEIPGLQPAGKETASLDEAGQLYIIANGTVNSNRIWVFKYNDLGQQVWVTPLSFSSNIICSVKSIAVDDDFVYVLGTRSGFLMTLKFDKLGIHRWTKTIGGMGIMDDIPLTIKVDNSGNIFTAGLVSDASYQDKLTVIKYDPLGNRKWIIKEQRDDIYQGTDDMEIDGNGDIYLSMSNGDFIICKYSTEGNLLWKDQYSDSSWGSIQEAPVALAYDGNDHVYVTGSSYQSGWWSSSAGMITTLQYDNAITYVDESMETLPNEFVLYQNYPNPFNPATTFRYSIPGQSRVILKLYGILGNEIEVLINEEKPAGTYEFAWSAGDLASGVYFYQLKAGEYISTKKMTFIK